MPQANSHRGTHDNKWAPQGVFPHRIPKGVQGKRKRTKLARAAHHGYAAQACMMFAVIASWISPAWIVALEGRPWQNEGQPVRGFSIWLGTFCLSLVIYFMTMHNHMGILLA